MVGTRKEEYSPHLTRLYCHAAIRNSTFVIVYVVTTTAAIRYGEGRDHRDAPRVPAHTYTKEYLPKKIYLGWL